RSRSDNGRACTGCTLRRTAAGGQPWLTAPRDRGRTPPPPGRDPIGWSSPERVARLPRVERPRSRPLPPLMRLPLILILSLLCALALLASPALAVTTIASTADGLTVTGDAAANDITITTGPGQ